MYTPISLFAIGFLCCTHALAFPAPAGLTSPIVSLIASNQTTTADPASIIRLQNTTTTHNPANFLGIECYHLLPNTVTLASCQPVFAQLFRGGDVYKERGWWNGCRFREGIEPCTIAISSPDRKDHRVRISLADVVVYATQVLQTCTEEDTGGAYTFQGSWRVVVTRDPIVEAAVAAAAEDSK